MPATMEAAACCLTAHGLRVPVASACPPLGLEQGARYWVLRRLGGVEGGMGRLRLGVDEGCGAGDPSDPSGHGWDRGCWHPGRAGRAGEAVGLRCMAKVQGAKAKGSGPG